MDTPHGLPKTPKKLGMIFPGQGSQFPGMGKDIFDHERIMQEYFEEASSCLDVNMTKLIFSSSEKELCQTTNAQASIFTLGASFYRLLHEKYGITPDIVAGHSVGEYTAIFAAGGISFADGLYLLNKRAHFMDEATRRFPGTMLAVLGLGYEAVKALCSEVDEPEGMEKVAEVVNYNAIDQFVVSGTVPELARVAELVKKAKGKAIPLNVAGAFHSRLMQEAEKQFALYMVKVDFKDLAIALVNNVQAKVITTPQDIKASLVAQMSGHVLWWPSMQHFADCDIILEIGPGTKLSKMLTRIWPDKTIGALNTMHDLETLLSHFGQQVDSSTFVSIPDEELPPAPPRSKNDHDDE